MGYIVIRFRQGYGFFWECHACGDQGTATHVTRVLALHCGRFHRCAG